MSMTSCVENLALPALAAECPFCEAITLVMVYAVVLLVYIQETCIQWWCVKKGRRGLDLILGRLYEAPAVRPTQRNRLVSSSVICVAPPAPPGGS